MNINLVPDIYHYPHIFNSHKDEKLVVFIGAGVPALWGCSLWKNMASALVHRCYEHGFLDYWATNKLLHKYADSPRKLITITKNILDSKYLPELEKTLGVLEDRKKKMPNIFRNLFSLNAVFITTNIDSNFDELFDKNKIHTDPNKFFQSDFQVKNLFHLHGVLSEPKSLVLTMNEYVDRYQNTNFTRFLENIFFDEKYCILFIGYGVDELEIIDFMAEKYSKGEKSLTKYLNRFYILLPFFKNEETLFKYERLYFSQINMTPIPYAIDEKGYDQLYYVLDVWKDKLTKPEQGDPFYNFNQIIDNNL
ncbi:MAG: SIR2 family protein [Nitrospinae bacterium]|nr:SIR2 family protein [Nitrospinota bacterium]